MAAQNRTAMEAGSRAQDAVIADHGKVVRAIGNLDFGRNFRYPGRQMDRTRGWNRHRYEQRKYQALF